VFRLYDNHKLGTFIMYRNREYRVEVAFYYVFLLHKHLLNTR